LALAETGLAKAETCCVVHVSSLKPGVSFPARKINALKESKLLKNPICFHFNPGLQAGEIHAYAVGFSRNWFGQSCKPT